MASPNAMVAMLACPILPDAPEIGRWRKGPRCRSSRRRGRGIRTVRRSCDPANCTSPLPPPLELPPMLSTIARWPEPIRKLIEHSKRCPSKRVVYHCPPPALALTRDLLHPKHVAGLHGIHGLRCFQWLTLIRGVCFRSPQTALGSTTCTLLRTLFWRLRGNAAGSPRAAGTTSGPGNRRLRGQMSRPGSGDGAAAARAIYRTVRASASTSRW